MSQLNPFTLTFGREPLSFIQREKQAEEVLNSFLPNPPECQAAMLTGVRGVGKTVLLTGIANQFRERKEWVVVDLNPERDMIQMLAAELSNKSRLRQIFSDASINLSFLGFGLNIDGVPPITDTTVALDRMLSALMKQGKKVLITIDEVTSTQRMREFTAQFQIFLRKGYPIFLLMTGLYENVNELQNEKSLTFLYRVPKIEVESLSCLMIARKYQEIFGLEEKESFAMAKATNGYAYAFQVLGYLCFKRELPYTEVLKEYDAYLSQYVYEKIWSELSDQDQVVLTAMARAEDDKVETIRKYAEMSSNVFSVYRNRLKKKGLVCAPKHGHLAYTLPRFKEFVLFTMY